jgi:carotenoid cleavage dioxygenase-like enzyme
MTTKLVNEFKSSIEKSDNPYTFGAWTPNHKEFDATKMEVIGQIPSDVDGVYLRNTENPIHEPIGRYHPFDGDGMIHSLHVKNGEVSYRNRFVRTKAFAAEQEAERSLWAGLAEHPSRSIRPGWGAQEALKDSSSTDVIVHAGMALSTFYQSAEGYRLDPVTLEQFGTEGWVPIDGISAHPKVDPRTGELLFFNYSKHAPYMHYGVVSANNKLKHYTPIPVPGPRLPHDMAFTENYSIMNDMPMFWNPEALAKGIHAVEYYPNMPSRFAVIPRYGNQDDIMWFEAAPTYVLHWSNAYEEGDEIVIDGYFQECPKPPNHPNAPAGLSRIMGFLANDLLKPRLHRWRFNLKTGETTEQRLDDRTREFGVINSLYQGVKYRYIYSVTNTPGYFQFDGLSKDDLETGERQDFAFGEQRYGSEPAFAPRINSQSEDDGYVVSIITDTKIDRSEFVIFDAKDITKGPICQVILPHRISSGAHGTWARGDEFTVAE